CNTELRTWERGPNVAPLATRRRIGRTRTLIRTRACSPAGVSLYLDPEASTDEERQAG
ncbi:hypothetical protein GPALN_012080, partial [Globodera pallida]